MEEEGGGVKAAVNGGGDVVWCGDANCVIVGEAVAVAVAVAVEVWWRVCGDSGREVVVMVHKR